MGKCLRSGRKQQRSSPTAAAAVEAAAYLTLRSGRRVSAEAASSPSRRRQYRRGGRCCGKAGAAWGAGAAAARQRRRRRVVAAAASQGRRREEEAELPPPTPVESPVVVCGEGCGGDRRVTPISGEAKRDHREIDAVTGRPPSSPPEAEVESFFAAVELAERRRFADTYNYDVALDRPLEGRFEWSPAVSA